MGTQKRFDKAKTKWAVAPDPVVVFLLTLQKLGWNAISHRELRTDIGQSLDLLRVAPGIVKQVAIAAVARPWPESATG